MGKLTPKQREVLEYLKTTPGAFIIAPEAYDRTIRLEPSHVPVHPGTFWSLRRSDFIIRLRSGLPMYANQTCVHDPNLPIYISHFTISGDGEEALGPGTLILDKERP